MTALRRAAYALGMAVRESGQALHRAGCRMQGDYRFTEQRMFSRLAIGGERPGAVAWLARHDPLGVDVAAPFRPLLCAVFAGACFCLGLPL